MRFNKKNIAEAIKDELATAMQTILINLTATSSIKPSINSLIKLTYDDIFNIAEDIQKQVEQPYKGLLEQHGFDPEKDWIFFDANTAASIGLTEGIIPNGLKKRVKILKEINQTVLIKNLPTFSVKINN